MAGLEGRVEEALVVIRVVDEREGRALNEQYRGPSTGRQGATNVLAFPFELPPGIPTAFQAPGPEAGGPSPEPWETTAPPLLGDVVVCLPVARREAGERGLPLPHHLAHLTVHGVLHLLGYGHECPADAQAMEAAEREVLARFGIPDPYAPCAEEGEEPGKDGEEAGGSVPRTGSESPEKTGDERSGRSRDG